MHSLAHPVGAMRPTFPAVCPSVQASMTTGRAPGAHGVVGGGVYRRQAQEVSFAERSNTLLSKKRFWHARDLPGAPKVSLVFWSNPLAGGADVVVGAATYGCYCGGVSHHPLGLYEDLAEALGPFDVDSLHGPSASFAAGQWIGRAAEEVWRSGRPDLQWVYLPGVDFELVRGGLSAGSVLEAMIALDGLAERLAAVVRQDGGEVVIVSDGGYVDVCRAASPNIRLREAGLLTVRQGEQGEMTDLHNSRAFAMVDHQFAHVYCLDQRAEDEAAEVLGALDGVDAVLSCDEAFCEGLGHDRAGERVLVADADAWFAYRWWPDGHEAAAVAGRFDAEGKCGYDPCELLPGGDDGGFDCDESHVRASRGRVDIEPADGCVLGATCDLEAGGGLCVTDLPGVLQRLMFA